LPGPIVRPATKLLTRLKEITIMLGPLENLVLQFKGNKFSGEIAPELRRIQEQGVVRIIDLTFIKKDQDGKVEAVELAELPGETAVAFDPLAGNLTGLLTREDVQAAAASLANNSSAAMLLIEHVWALQFKEALLNANATLLARERVPAEVAAQLEAEIAGKK
jgi:hypothetical protein